MMNLRADNEILRFEKERNMKILLDRKNLRNLDPTLDNGNREETRRQQGYHPKGGGARMDNEEESGNTSSSRGPKWPKIELQGEFKKIKPPLFEWEEKEAIEAWLINMNKYFQIYEDDDNLKAWLEVYQLQGKATQLWEEIKTVRSINEQEAT